MFMACLLSVIVQDYFCVFPVMLLFNNNNDAKCSDLGWVCIPLVVESYGAWGKEALEAFSMLASRLATSSSRPKSMVLSELYGRLNLHLVRANVRAILCRLSCHHQEYI